MNPNDNSAAAGRVRTSDAERERIAGKLRNAMGEGRLTLEEGEQRLAAAYAATFRDEFAALTRDLPGDGRRTRADGPESRYPLPGNVRRLTGFVLFAGLILAGLWVLSALLFFFWPVIPLVVLFTVVRRHRRWRQGYSRFGYAYRVAPWNGPHWP